MRSTVVLPDPDGPRIANSSPSSTVRSAPSTATTPLVPCSWNTLRTPINSICGFPWAVGFVLLLEDGPVDDTVAVPESGPAGMARIVWIGGSNCSPKYGFRMEPVFHRLFPSVGYLGPPSRNFDTSVTSGAGENIEVVVIPWGACRFPGATYSSTPPSRPPCSAWAARWQRSPQRRLHRRRPRRP